MLNISYYNMQYFTTCPWVHHLVALHIVVILLCSQQKLDEFHMMKINFRHNNEAQTFLMSQ